MQHSYNKTDSEKQITHIFTKIIILITQNLNFFIYIFPFVLLTIFKMFILDFEVKFYLLHLREVKEKFIQYVGKMCI